MASLCIHTASDGLMGQDGELGLEGSWRERGRETKGTGMSDPPSPNRGKTPAGHREGGGLWK